MEKLFGGVNQRSPSPDTQLGYDYSQPQIRSVMDLPNHGLQTSKDVYVRASRDNLLQCYYIKMILFLMSRLYLSNQNHCFS